MSYAELHAKSNFSFLEGASHPEELAERAAQLGYAALAVTDRNSLAGVVRAHVAAKDHGLKLLVGAEITPVDAAPLVLLATDRASYGRLARLITTGRRRAEKGQCVLTFDDVASAGEGLLAGLLPAHAEVHPPRNDNTAEAWQARRGHWRRYREAFGDRAYVLAELHYGPDDETYLHRLVEAAQGAKVPVAAAGDVHYHARGRSALYDVLVATRLGKTVAEVGEQRFANAQRYLKPVDEIQSIFAAAPGAVRRTAEIADRVSFSLDELRYEYPEEIVPEGLRPIEHLARLAWQGARDRYPAGVPEKVVRLIEHELRLIEELRYEAYFLTVWDLVVFARGRGILCQGRGSAANSAVCYCLGVTSVDPGRTDLLFERFVSRERNEAPDIDIDFEHQRREEVLQYLYEKYGRERAGMTAEVITYRPRSAVRDVGKALGLSADCVARLAKRIERFHEEPDLPERLRESGLDPQSPLGLRLVAMVEQLVGFPRHLSQHTGGMVMTRGPLCEMVPIENAAMPDRTVIQWNKDDLDALNILKVDCLALGMLSAIHRCFDLVAKHDGRETGTGSRPTCVPTDSNSPGRVPVPVSPGQPGPALTLASIPEGDPEVYAMIRRADTMGVFQIESRAQMSMLPRLKPRNFYDLVIEVAIVRPGPIQGNMVHPYLRRRNGEEPVEYPCPEIREVLEKTLGVPLFQEQAMRLAMVAAGFTPGEADQLRRAMGAWRRPGLIDQFRRRLVEGMLARGLTEQYAEAVFRQLRGFGEYGFPESHAASFALLVYVSAWLKHHHPAAFTAALLNSQPMGFYGPAQLVRDARNHGVEVRAVDVNHSDWDCTLEPIKGSGVVFRPGAALESSERESAGPENDSRPLYRHGLALRLGFRMIDGLGETQGRRIEAARRGGPFVSIDDFARRTGSSRAAVARWVHAGAFGSLYAGRREALWHALESSDESLPLFDQNTNEAVPETVSDTASPPAEPETVPDTVSNATLPAADEQPGPELPPMTPAQEMLADYRATGLSLRAHPLQFLRQGLERMQVVPASMLSTIRNGAPVRVAGIVLMRQRPSTAKGITFITLEDESGVANLIVRPDVWKKFRTAALGATVLLAAGRLQREGRVIHVLVHRLEDLSAQMGDLSCDSRDFR